MSNIFFNDISDYMNEFDKVVVYYDNGQVRTQMFFVNGDANGESLWYYRHGALRERGNYANDLANGESKLYTPSGVLEYTIIYRDGREISRTTHNIKGKI